MKHKIFINSIYLATEGEGIFLGTPQVFVRLQGCKIGCSNCDSKDTWEFDPKMEIPMEEAIQRIYRECEKADPIIKRVSITGGDPTDPRHVEPICELASYLKSRGFYINIEASGLVLNHKVFDLVDFVSFDFKTPTTGIKGRQNLIQKMAEQYKGKFQVKSVIQEKEDFTATFDTYKNLKEKMEDVAWCLTPAYIEGEEFPQNRFVDVLHWNENAGAPFRVIGQQHKLIFGPDRKDV